MAEEKLGKKLDESIYITITDHIYSAVQRYQNGLVIRNTMRWEIQRYYPDEYAVGLQAAQIIRDTLYPVCCGEPPQIMRTVQKNPGRKY